jgi:hypothetical protein
MFIRRTKSRQTDDRAYYTHRLVRSEREGGRVRQRTLLNLGRHFDIDRDRWPLLCQRVEQILAGQTDLLGDAPDDVEREAQRIAAQLLARGAAGTRGVAGGDVQAVAVGSLALARPRSVGVEHVALWALGELGLPALLATLGINAALRDAALGALVARMAFPASERATHRWLRERSAAGELLGVDFETMGAMQPYRASDALMAHRAAIETHLFDAAMELFDLQPTVTLFDLTNTYFEGAAGDMPKAARGHSKEKRSDCPLLTLGLVLDASGFARRSRVFSGSVREHDTLEEMLSALGAPAGALVVMDRGIATEDRVAWLRGAGYRYLVVGRERRRRFDAAAAVAHGTRSGRTVQLHRVETRDPDEVRLHCCSPERADKERAIVERSGRRFERALAELNDGLSRPRARRSLDRIRERIGRLKANSRGAAQHYEVDVVADAGGEKAVAVRWTRRPVEGSMATHPGVYCLRTNVTDWDAATLWRTYTALTDLEAVFRSLKSELGLRPIHHRKPVRAEGHLFITVIACQAVQVVRRRLAAAGERASWTTLRNVLAGQQRVTATFQRADARTLHVRTATAAEPAQKAIYDVLGIDPHPGGTRRTVV